MHSNLYQPVDEKASIFGLTLGVGVDMGGATKDDSFTCQFNGLSFTFDGKIKFGLVQSEYIPQYSVGCSYLFVIDTWFDLGSNHLYGLRLISLISNVNLIWE